MKEVELFSVNQPGRREGFLRSSCVDGRSYNHVLVISNCVIALVENKPAVFTEINRILRPGGRFIVSDVVTERRHCQLR